MKMKWSVISTLPLLLFALSCAKEEFGGSAQTQTQSASGVKVFEDYDCSKVTMVRPPVDILYVVDNTGSTHYISDDIKRAMINTVNSISSEFDYRVIGIPLIGSSTTDYQVLTNSADLSGIPSDSRRINSAWLFNFFNQKIENKEERGLSRVHDFMNAHVSDGLFRKGAYHLVVLFSNSRDWSIEKKSDWNDGVTVDSAALLDIKTKLDTLKSAANLNSLQFRLFSVTAHENGPEKCTSGSFSSKESYVAVSKYLYDASMAKDQDGKTYPDSYDLCKGKVSSIFESVNASIKKVTLNHHYRYWPITFANDSETVSIQDVKVFKYNKSTKTETELPRFTAWDYFPYNNSSEELKTRELPTPGEPKAGKHFVKFTDGNLIQTPDCVYVRSVSKTEYFGFVPLSQRPKVESIVLMIKGRVIPKSDTNGWSYMGDTPLTQNIKVADPSSGETGAPVIKTGFMLKLNGADNYYKSGDKVDVNFVPAPL